VDVDGLVYQIHRGPRRRVVRAWTDSEGAWQGRFVLDDGIWAVPVPPQPEPVDCPWCADGPPDTADAAQKLELDDVDGWLRFALAVKPAARRKLRAGLERILPPPA
jgi:hypothetical protein